MTNLDLIKKSRELLTGHWLIAIVVIIISSFFTDAPKRLLGDEFSLIILLLGGAFQLGLAIYFLNVVLNDTPDLGNLFDGFRKYIPATVAFVLSAVVIVIGFILLIIPGVIAILGLSQTFFILAEDKTNMSGVDAMKKSWEMMEGFKIKYFLLSLIHIGMVILGLLCFVVGIFYALPIIYTSMALFYVKLKRGELQPV